MKHVNRCARTATASVSAAADADIAPVTIRAPTLTAAYPAATIANTVTVTGNSTIVNQEDEADDAEIVDEAPVVTMEDLEEDSQSSVDPSRVIADMGTKKRNRLTCNEFYKFLIAVRTVLSILHFAGKLYQKYLVDAWLKCEANTLEWFRRNQPTLRAESYTGLRDFLAKRAEHGNARPGIAVVLPSSFPVILIQSI